MIMPISDQVRHNLGKASWIRRMFEEGDRLRLELGPEAVYDFTLGNPDAEPPKEFAEALLNLAKNPPAGMHRYMSNAGYKETRMAVADYLADQCGLPVNADHVVMTCGAGGALNVILKTLVNPGEEVIVIAPYFAEYLFYIENHGGKAVAAQSDELFQLDMAALSAAITPKTRAIIINSPNNPTGVVYPEEALRRLQDLLAAKEAEFGGCIYVISDEPYAKLVYDGIKTPPVFAHLKHSLIATSHSKDLALAGERIGYAAVNPDLPDTEEIFAGLVFANRVLGYVNAPAMMQRLIAPLQGMVVGLEQYVEKRDLLVSALTGMGFKMVKPSGAFYLFPRSPLEDDVQFVQMAVKHGILLVPGRGFGRPGYFRLAYCVPGEMIRRSLPAFASLAKEAGLA